MSIQIFIQPTPNPNAWKFVLENPVKTTEGTSSYKTPKEAEHNGLASTLFTIRGVDQVHMFNNVITITKFGYEDWDVIESQVRNILTENIPTHNANYEDPDPERERRGSLAPELQKIEDILDRTIRPGLQGDGGDIQTVTLDDNVLIVRYQGACGTCPSSTTGTLEAIRAILRDEYHPEIEVYIAPDH